MIIRSLRAKLALSHVLPILLLTPLLSLYLIYSLEEFFTQELLQQLTQQTHLLFAQVAEDGLLLDRATAAQAFLATVARQTDARVLLLTNTGVILGSTRAEDSDRIGTRYQDPAITQALQGEFVQGIGPGLTAEVIYVVAPIYRDNGVQGALRVSYEVDDIRSQFNQVRRYILGGVALTLLLGLGLGLSLAWTITQPLRQLRARVQEIAQGNYQARVDLQRQDEVGVLAQSVNQMAIQLEEGRLARQQQLAAVVHELTRPLTGMRAAVETLVDGAAEEAEMRTVLLTGLAEELARLARLIATLQDVQRRELKPLQVSRTPIALERVLQASISHFEPVATQLGVTLTLSIPEKLPSVNGDEDRLIQVLINLLDNALKFTPRGGKIAVHAVERAEAIWVSVSDSGVGIAAHEIPYLFQQFYRGDEARTPEKQGMGLGLTICREIIEAHGGQIWAESKPDQGAHFTFTLPKA